MAHILHTTGASVWSRRGESATGSDANHALAASERSNRAVQRAAGGPNPWTRWRPEYSTFGPSEAPTGLFRAKRTCSPPSPRIRIVPLSRFFRAKRGRFPCANPGRLPLMRQSKISPICPIRAFLQRFLPVDNFFSPRGRVQRALADRPAAETCQRSPLRQPRSDRQALGGIQAPVSAAAPLLLWSTGNGVSGRCPVAYRGAGLTLWAVAVPPSCG